VPLPATMLVSLRKFWKTHRHPKLVFPAVGRGWRERATQRSAGAGQSMSISSIQHCFRLARAAAAIKGRGDRPYPASPLRDAPARRRSEPAPDRRLPRTRFTRHHRDLHAPDRGEREARALAAIDKLNRQATA
jgi:hypothetical protein